MTGNLSIQDGRINGNSAPDGAVHVAAGTFFASFRTHWGSDDSANTRHDVVCEEGRWPYDFDGGPHDFWCDGSVCR